MNQDIELTRRLLQRFDPAPVEALDTAELETQRRVTLRRILASGVAGDFAHQPVAAPRTAPRPRLVMAGIAAALVVVLAGALTVLPRGQAGTAYAATPPMLDYTPAPELTAAGVLEQAAAAAEAQPPAVGTYQYLERAGWYLDTSVSEGVATSEILPETEELWITGDGSGRWVSMDASGKIVADEPVAAGELTTFDLTALPLERTALGAQLLGDPQVPGDDNAGIPDDIERVERATEILTAHAGGGRLPPPALRAALFRVLADQDLTVFGRTTDRAGRPAVAVGMDADYSGLPTSHRLLIDPDTGNLLAEEEILTTDAGALNVPIPSVISYTLNLASGAVPDTEARP